MTRIQPVLSILSRNSPGFPKCILCTCRQAIKKASFPTSTQYARTSAIRKIPSAVSNNTLPSRLFRLQQRHLATTSAQLVEEPTHMKSTLVVTDRAVKQLNLINAREKTLQALRVIVDSGGCHGYQVKLELTSDNLNEDDLLIERDGAKVMVDAVSLALIEGSKLDYVQELIGSSFQVIDNPKAESSCGCKTSFNIKI